MILCALRSVRQIPILVSSFTVLFTELFTERIPRPLSGIIAHDVPNDRE